MRRVHRQFEILEHQPGREAALVILVRRAFDTDAGQGGIGIQGPAIARGLRADLVEFLRIEPELLGHFHRLGGADHRDGKQHVVADLSGLARARIARVDYRLAHRVQHLFGARERLDGSADHEGERSAIGCGDPARHRRIDHVVSGSLGQRDDLFRGGDIDRRAVEQNCAFGGLADYAAFVDRFHDPAIGQHRDDAVDTLNGFGRVGEGGAAIVSGSRQCFFRQVEGVYLMPRLDEVCGHPAAHIAEADKGDFHWSILSHFAASCSRADDEFDKVDTVSP